MTPGHPGAQVTFTAIGTLALLLILAAACIAIGWVGEIIARRRGYLCPDCGYWGSPQEVTDHRAREHEIPSAMD